MSLKVNDTALSTIAGALTVAGETICNGNSKVETSSTVAQSIPNGAFTDVKFEIKDVDLLSEITEPGGTYTLFTAKAATGTYAVSWAVRSVSAAWDAGEYWYTALSRNNSTSEGDMWLGTIDYHDAATTRAKYSCGSAKVTLAATNTLRIKVNHTQGGAVNTGGTEYDCYFHIARIP